MIVSSLVMIGQAYQHMAASIYAVPLPKGLDEDGMKTYKAGIDKMAQPFQKQAVENYEAAIARGFQLEGYNESLKMAQIELSRLDNAKHPNYNEMAVITKLPDTMEVEQDSDLGQPFKANDENALVGAASKRLGKNPDDLKALSALALYYMNQGKYGMARILWSRAEKNHAKEPGIHNNYGVIALSENKLRMALGHLHRANELNKNYAIANANLGSVFCEYKDYARAVDLLSAGYGAVKRDLRRGVTLDVANNYALALSGTGKFDKAEDIIEDILKVDSQNTVALVNLAIMQIQKQKDMKAGEKTLNKLKFLADDSQTQKRVEELEAAIKGN
jgi:Tfp pilus assembly protein PilF